MQINFISSKDSGETRTMHTKSRNIEIMVGSETNDIIEELSESPLQNYQKGLEESIRGNELICDIVDLLYYHLQKNKSEQKGIVIYRFSQMAKK